MSMRPSLFQLIKKTGVNFVDDNAIKLAASLSYYTIFAIAPMLIVVMTLAGWFQILILLALVTGLAIGANSIIGAAARDSKLPKGAPVTPAARRSGRRAMLIAAVIVSTVYYFAFVWGNSDASEFTRIARIFTPPKLALTLEGANRLAIRAADSNEPVIAEKVYGLD